MWRPHAKVSVFDSGFMLGVSLLPAQLIFEYCLAPYFMQGALLSTALLFRCRHADTSLLHMHICVAASAHCSGGT